MRGRQIKPGFFKNEVLGAMSYEVRLLFIGLWAAADRMGRLEDRPERLRAEIFPYDDIDVSRGLDALEGGGFIVRYEREGMKLLHVTNFLKHQSPHHTERKSQLPGINGGQQELAFVDIAGDQVQKFLRRVWKCGAFQNADWREWVILAVTSAASMPAALTDLVDLVEYVEMCADPEQRARKDLGELKNPAGYIVKGLKQLANKHGIYLPACPRLKKEGAA